MIFRLGPIAVVAALTFGLSACGANEATDNDAAENSRADGSGRDQGVGLQDSASDRGGESEADSGAEADSGGGGDPSPALCDPVAGTREAVVIRVAFDEESPVCTAEALRTTWFAGESAVASFYDQASGGRLSLEGRVTEAVSIAPPAECIGTDPTPNQQLLRSLYPQVDGAAAAKGISISGDATRVYVLPASIRCGTKGPAGATSSPLNRIFLYGDTCESTKISAHELGHILGTNHAAALDATSGKVREYGDGSDIMGHGFFPPNGPHRAQLGWIPTDKAVTVVVSGTYRLSALATDEDVQPQLLVVNRHDDASKAVYVSYRHAAGLDATLPTEFRERTSVHEFTAACPPPDARTQPKTLLLGTVGDGEEHRIDDAGITIRQLSHDHSGAIVEIVLDR